MTEPFEISPELLDALEALRQAAFSVFIAAMPPVLGRPPRLPLAEAVAIMDRMERTAREGLSEHYAR